MKFWMSGECDVKVYDDYRIVRAQIEKDVNRILKSNDYGSGVTKLNVIPIILSKAAQNDLFNEIKRFDRKKRESEFRLHVSLARFRSATLTEKYHLIRTKKGDERKKGMGVLKSGDGESPPFS
ncbi:Imm44 family immunity protein [Roseiconus lacunae]|uniref:Imm44 family immunity protein n=1 Tax=Roseiconus lacunae TaxID=2605694 RepID=A0ABT7PGV9_9BACT|nr:Imm44 family immunity protein [Roseiconus lacunae]MDM4015734.1 Imm44 family immunity protein [Roseiconus lacunae]